VSFPVWQYWEGPQPPYVGLCLETVRRHYPAAGVLDRRSFDEQWQHDRDVPIDHLGPHHRADFIRVYLLRHHGGLWLDCDFVQLRPLAGLSELPEGVTFAGYRQDGREFANGLMFSVPGDPVVAHTYAQICEHLRDRRPINWLDIGSLPLNRSIDAYGSHVHELNTDLVCPIPWHQASRFEEAGEAGWLAADHRWGVMLCNNSMSEALREQPREAVIESDSVLGDLLRKALA
jgi:hypothetical protein